MRDSPDEQQTAVDLDAMRRWRRSTRLLIFESIGKTSIRITAYVVFLLWAIAFELEDSKQECFITWMTDTKSISNVQDTGNFIPCNRGYDILNINDAGFDFINGDLCAENVTLIVSEQNCPHLISTDGTLKAPMALFVDVNFDELDLITPKLGDPTSAGYPDGELDLDENCFMHDAYIYPCDRKLLGVYNDTIIMTDTNGTTVDISTDLVPLYSKDTIGQPDPVNLTTVPDEPYHEWVPEAIFPNRLENVRFKNWSYFRKRQSINPSHSRLGIESLPIGRLEQDMKLPISVEIQDRWFTGAMPQKFSKTLRFATPQIPTNGIYYLSNVILLVMIVLDVIHIASEIIKLLSLKWVNSKHQLPQWIGHLKEPFAIIRLYRSENNAPFECGTDSAEASRRISVATRRRGSAMSMLQPEGLKKN